MPGAREPISIRPLAPRDMAPFWRLRLRALREHPRSFGPSYDEIRAVHDRARPPVTVDIWTVDTAEPAGDDAIFVAVDRGGDLIGFIGVERDPWQKSRHRVVVRAAYVVREAQGRGIGKRLVRRVLEHAGSLPGVTHALLEVTADRRAAVRCYESVGFTRYGVDRDALVVDGERADVLLMVKRL